MLDFDDLSVFFDTKDGIADEILVGPEWEETAISGIFSETYQALEGGGQARVSSRAPNALIQNSDIADLGIAMGTRIVVDDEAYSVTDVQPDGPGTSRLFLHKDRRGRAC